MNKRRKHSKRIIGPGVGHTTQSKLPPIIEEQANGHVRQLFALGGEPDSRFFNMGHCYIILSHSDFGWHLSISHPHRYPNWDEIAEARYKLIPNEATMAMVLPPREAFLNIHKNCFHLWQVKDEREGVGVLLPIGADGFNEPLPIARLP